MQADSPIDLISRELLLSSLHPGVSCFEGAQKGGKCGMPAFFFFSFFKGGSGKRVMIFKQLLWAGLMRKTVRNVTKTPLT